jgi:ABC-type sugar transport system permease subunit
MNKNFRQSLCYPILFLAPAFLLLGLFVLWPMLRALYWSFTDATLLTPGDASFSPINNYSHLLKNDRFRQAFINTSLFALMVIPVQTILAFFLALWVNRPERPWRILRTVFFVPVVVSMPVLAVLWTMLYQPARGTEMGLVNMLLDLFGYETKAWLSDPILALPAIAVMSIWQGVGFQMMVFLAGLQNLQIEQIEASIIDGANAWQRLRYIIVPGMKNSIIFVLTATLILAFRLFVQPYLMTRGGPHDRTLSIIQLIYETTFLNRELGLASAGAMLFLLLVALLTMIKRLFGQEVKA